MTTLGLRLKKIRNELHLSQEAFGEKIGMTRAGIAAVEADNNNFSQEALLKLLLVFNININYLLSGIGVPFNKPECSAAGEKILFEIKNILANYSITELQSG